ncbi:hypothetical protein AB0Y04_00425 [Loigolactobacillus coryniformis]|uniref:hypothetical protein n=1 Tax=Loigolactobacillus coryniformis TaxID=1610 RepID=UPI003F220309
MTDLFETLRQPAINAGIPATEYDDMPYLQIISQIKANRLRHEEQLREQAIMDHTQASLMAFAMNDPQKMPSIAKAYPFLDKFQEGGQSQPEQAPAPEWQNDQAMLIQQAMVVKATLQRKRAQQK